MREREREREGEREREREREREVEERKGERERESIWFFFTEKVVRPMASTDQLHWTDKRPVMRNMSYLS